MDMDFIWVINDFDTTHQQSNDFVVNHCKWCLYLNLDVRDVDSLPEGWMRNGTVLCTLNGGFFGPVPVAFSSELGSSRQLIMRPLAGIPGPLATGLGLLTIGVKISNLVYISGPVPSPVPDPVPSLVPSPVPDPVPSPVPDPVPGDESPLPFGGQPWLNSTAPLLEYPLPFGGETFWLNSPAALLESPVPLFEPGGSSQHAREVSSGPLYVHVHGVQVLASEAEQSLVNPFLKSCTDS